MKSENRSCLPILRLGVLVNPRAGLGGPPGYKGSDCLPDHLSTPDNPWGSTRMRQVLQGLSGYTRRINCYCPGGVMGEKTVIDAGLTPHCVFRPVNPSTADDTRSAARALQAAGVDILLFAGGDGTARDLCHTGLTVPVLGIPSGVKMHSGVFAVSPASAVELLVNLLDAGGVAVESMEVRDLDEEALRTGKVRPQFYGELNVPVDTRLMQQVKCASTEQDELVQTEIAASVAELLEPGVVYLFGPGSTNTAIMAQLGYRHTLLGFDAVKDGELVGTDLDSRAISGFVEEFPVKLLLTATGGQGMLLGRGNQQLTPDILKKAGKAALWVVATPAKLRSLDGRPLRLDTGDAELDREWAGTIQVTTGYRQRQLYWLA